MMDKGESVQTGEGEKKQQGDQNVKGRMGKKKFGEDRVSV